MSLNAELARLGVTGAFYASDRGVHVPVPTGFTPWADEMSDAGYISDQGLSEDRSEDRKEFIPWQSRSAIRTTVTKGTKTFKAVLWETNWTTVSLYYGIQADDVTVTGTGDDQVVSFADKDVPEQDRRAFGFDVIDGTYARRMFCPGGEVTERGGIVYRSDELIAYDVTVTAYPDQDNNSVYRLFMEGWAPPTA